MSYLPMLAGTGNPRVLDGVKKKITSQIELDLPILADKGTAVYYAKPCASFGYYRGSPIYNGDGGTEGPQIQGVGMFPQGEGTDNRPKADYSMIYCIAIIGILGTFLACYLVRSKSA